MTPGEPCRSASAGRPGRALASCLPRLGRNGKSMNAEIGDPPPLRGPPPWPSTTDASWRADHEPAAEAALVRSVNGHLDIDPGEARKLIPAEFPEWSTELSRVVVGVLQRLIERSCASTNAADRDRAAERRERLRHELNRAPHAKAVVGRATETPSNSTSPMTCGAMIW